MSDLEAGGPERRARITADIMAKTGIDKPMIERLVRLFYQRIQAEPVLGPIFDRAIGDGWDAHLAKLCDFWSSVMLMTGRFKGQPMAVHTRLPDIHRHHFARWLEMFARTARDVCPPKAAQVLWLNCSPP